MKNSIALLLVCFALNLHSQSDFTVTFGSCNKPQATNLLWDDVIASHPDVWIWGGDIVYADSYDMTVIEKSYQLQQEVAGYQQLKKTCPIIGIWDDHDYGSNDGGSEYAAKQESQQLFLDFLEVPQDSPRRDQEGIYSTAVFSTQQGSVRVILLDTRYFRTQLKSSGSPGRRYDPIHQGTMLGQAQWNWLEKTLKETSADFNLIVSSIQVLSDQQGFEGWGTMPHERQKLLHLIADSGAPGIMILSGDRHISEFSQVQLDTMSYPLVDFTSSGLTHAYESFTSEHNPHRISKVIAQISYGRINFDFKNYTADISIITDNNLVLETHQLQFKK